ncbi:MFS transporter [Kutzneria kofuensis]|uniref:MFS family permease n=1 Tax=Kutzneria kofuensis TaxID=103725 RepID=A0A7W9KGA9_9PSEU|nr:MFS transporter [Kutzneria kofuensis]MBB5892066.1 MFS family permease [Kutzneria kofuensis]
MTAADTTSAPPRRGLLAKLVLDTRPLKVLAYRRLWLSTVITAIGSQLTAVAVPKQVYDLTGSSAYVGVAGAVALVPLLVFGLWGGAVADVMDRRKLLLITNTGIAVVSVLLWLQALTAMGSVTVVLVLLGLQQAFFAVNMPARSASIARLVPLEMLPSANALGSTVQSFGAVLGPMLAGALIPVLGLSTLYLIDAIGLTATLWAVWKLPALPPLDGVRRTAGLRSVIDGFRYLSTKSVLLASFLADIVAMVFGMPRALFPEMAERTFHDPAGGGPALGWLFAAIPLGALLFGLMSGWLSRITRHGVAVWAAVAAWGVAIIGLGLSSSLWLAVVFLALAGAADMVSMVFRGAILQAAATDDMRGRMQGVFTVVVAGGPRLADVLHGTAGAAVGTTVAVSGGGVAVLIAIAVAAVALPAMWRYRAPVSE